MFGFYQCFKPLALLALALGYPEQRNEQLKTLEPTLLCIIARRPLAFNFMQLSIFTASVKYCFLLAVTPFLVFSLHASPAAAQSSATPLSSTHAVADSILQIAHEDTTYALQRLFHENRRRYGLQVALRGVGLGYFATFTVLKTFKEVGNTEQKIVNASLVAVAGYLFTRSLIGLYRYRSGRERKLLNSFEQGHPIPFRVRKVFKPSYFDAPTTNN